MGIFYKAANKEGVIAGMLAGLTITLSYIVYFKFYAPGLNNASHWFLGISPEGFGVIGMLTNLLIILLATKCFPKPPSEVYKMIDEIRQP